MTRPPGVALGALLVAAGLTILDVSKVGVSTPAIQQSLGADDVEVQVMVVGYTIAYAVFLIPAGRLGDLISRKWVFLAGLGLFGAASLLCALATDPGSFTVARAVQGAAAGVLMPQVIGLIQVLYPAADRTRPLSRLAVVIAITSAAGPVLAGAIMTLDPSPDGWRWLFWINVAAAAAAIPVVTVLITAPPASHRPGFDGPGAALLVAAVALIATPLTTVSAQSGATPAALLAFGAGLIAAVCCAWRVRARLRRGREPILDPSLFRLPSFSSGLAVTGLMYASGTAASLVIAIELQRGAGLSPLVVGLILLPAALIVSAGASLVGRLPTDAAARWIPLGILLSAAGFALIALAIEIAPTAALPLTVGALLLLQGFGKGLVASPNQALVLRHVPEFRASSAASTVQLAQRGGSAVGMAVSLLIAATPGVRIGSVHLDGDALAILFCVALLAVAFAAALRDLRRRRRAPA
ncbi:MAG: MFS transporter [Microbacteriaceae bacterium]